MSKKNKKTTFNEPRVRPAQDAGDSEELIKDERDALSTVPPDVFNAEDQKQRWMKYGANVVLTTVVVVLLAALALWAFNADRIPFRGKSISLKGRADLTSDSSNELKPQTKQLIQDLPEEVTLVSLYPKLKKEEAASKGADTYQRVLDILDEYRRSGKNIKVEAIDPVSDPARLDAWLGQIKRTYGANIDKYEKFLKEEVPASIEEIRKQAETETAKLREMVQGIDTDALTSEQRTKLGRPIQGAFSTVASMPDMLKRLSELSQELLVAKIPDYSAAVKLVRDGTVAPVGPFVQEIHGMSQFRDNSSALVKLFNNLKDDQQIPEAVRKYAAEATKSFQNLQDKADELLKKADGLGELKLDDVRRKLIPAEDGAAAPPAIAIMSKDDVKVIEDSALWTSGETTGMTGSASETPRLRFAGEQQLTSAILSLAQPKKTKVAFIRAGGGPLLSSGGGMMGMESGDGPFSMIADRLRAYNFEVIEKDLGPQQRPDPTQPSDEDIKDAIWIVYASSDQMDPRMGMPTTGMLGNRLKQHLDSGGSALCFTGVGTEDLATPLNEWGIEAKPNVVLLHERVEGPRRNTEDFVEMARREPAIFVINEYGDHPITNPLRTLDMAMQLFTQVRKAPSVPAGVKVTEIIPMPPNPKPWGETDLSFLRRTLSRQAPPEPTYDPAVDVAPPLFAGAAAEKEGKGRLVVLGSPSIAHNGLMSIPDVDLQERTKMVVARFPGNGELVTNSVFWLAKQDSMMALGPAALDTARIEPIPSGKLSFIKIGLVLVILPLLSVAAGISVWLSRRA